MEAFVPAAQVRWLINEAELQVGGHSPLLSLFGVEPQGSRADLARAGLLDPGWAPAFQALCHPDREIRIVVVTPDHSFVRTYYTGPAAEALVGCWRENGRLRFLYPVDPATIVQHAAELYRPRQIPAAAPVAMTLGGSALLAMAALVDALRTRLFLSLLERRGARELAFDHDELRREVERGSSAVDARWMITLLRLSLTTGVLPGADALPEGLRELSRLGLAAVSSRDGGRVVPSETVVEWASYWKVPLPALIHSCTRHPADGPPVAEHLLTWRGDGPLFSLALEAGVGGSADLRTVSIDEYAAAVEAMFAWTARLRCGSCGVSLRPGLRFCTSCGAPRG